MPAGRPPMGPRPLPGTDPAPLPFRRLEEIGLAEDVGLHGLQTDIDEIGGLLQPFSGHARRFLTALLRGGSRGMASMAAGVDLTTIQRWEKQDPGFAEATGRAANLGFTTTFERELYSRALAGQDDRGSMRALELVVKARDASYREKTQVQMDVIMRAQGAEQALAGGWLEAIPEGDSANNV